MNSSEFVSALAPLAVWCEMTGVDIVRDTRPNAAEGLVGGYESAHHARFNCGYRVGGRWFYLFDYPDRDGGYRMGVTVRSVSYGFLPDEFGEGHNPSYAAEWYLDRSEYARVRIKGHRLFDLLEDVRSLYCSNRYAPLSFEHVEDVQSFSELVSRVIIPGAARGDHFPDLSREFFYSVSHWCRRDIKTPQQHGALVAREFSYYSKLRRLVECVPAMRNFAIAYPMPNEDE